MTTKSFHIALLPGVTLFCLGLTACSTKIRLTTTGTTFIPGPVDLASLKCGYSKITNRSATKADLTKYNCEVRGAVEQLIQRRGTPGTGWNNLKTKDGKVHLRVNHSRFANFDRVDKILIADTISITNGIEEPCRTDGVGVPLLARVTKTKSDYLIPEKGVWVPLTAVIDPGGKTPTMCLFDTTLPVCGSPFPLAADFSAPLARGFRDRQKEFQRTKALFNFDRFEEEMGIQRVFGFHPEKTPVVFVHGVFSSSTTWANAINCLTADPEIRKHFEFWNFRFPTGAPIPYLAQQLRKDVAAMHRFRCANGATSNRVVMVGHSMGGLMSKMLTQHSGEKQWNQFFAEPPEKLDVSRETRETLRDMFYFKPLPYVKCVIFTATPHRGSEATHWNIVQMLQPLIRTPETVLDATRNVLQTSVNALTPLGLESAQDFPNSLQHMEYNSRIGDIFADLPLNCDVTYHSIIGSEKGTDIPKDEMTDGVVSYKSAHIPGVESEIIVESGHGVQRTRAGIAEIGRIIKSER